MVDNLRASYLFRGLECGGNYVAVSQYLVKLLVFMRSRCLVVVDVYLLTYGGITIFGRIPLPYPLVMDI